MSETPSKVAQVVAVLLLVTMVTLSVTGDRDDKAWTWMTGQVDGWFSDKPAPKPKTPTPK